VSKFVRFSSSIERSHIECVTASWSDSNCLLQIALKCADICNPCRPWKISKRWSRLVCEEFFQQGYSTV